MLIIVAGEDCLPFELARAVYSCHERISGQCRKLLSFQYVQKVSIEIAVIFTRSL